MVSKHLIRKKQDDINRYVLSVAITIIIATTMLTFYFQIYPLISILDIIAANRE